MTSALTPRVESTLVFQLLESTVPSQAIGFKYQPAGTPFTQGRLARRARRRSLPARGIGRADDIRRGRRGSAAGRCKLDPGLKAPGFQKFNLMKRNLLYAFQLEPCFCACTPTARAVEKALEPPPPGFPPGPDADSAVELGADPLAFIERAQRVREKNASAVEVPTRACNGKKGGSSLKSSF